MTVDAQQIAANVQSVRGRIAAACQRAGRDAADVRLIGVVKTATNVSCVSLLSAGVTDLAENRVQQMEQRHTALGGVQPPPVWHLIGHLQRNKVRKVWGLTHYIHSVDSVRLARELGRERRRRVSNGMAQVEGPHLLVELNIAGEEQKTGLSPSELRTVLQACRQESLSVQGLMTMAPYGAPEDELRRVFSTLRQWRDRAVEEGWAEALPELSMGMSDDFEIAVEEGATMVRIGRALLRGGDE